MRRWGVGLAVLASALPLAACGDDDDDAGSDPTTTAAPADDGDEETTTTTEAPDEGDEGDGGEVQAVTVTAADYSFGALPEISEGIVELTLENTGGVDHEIALLELGDDTTLDDFSADFEPVLEGGPFPEYGEVVLGTPAVGAGETQTFTMTVPAGRYAAFCTFTGDAEGTPAEGEEEAEGPAHYTRGMLAELEVAAGDGGEAALPETDGTINAVDYAFEFDIEAGDTTLTFTNDGPDQVHFAGISVFPEGTTAEDAEAAFATLLELPEDQPPPDGTIFPEDVADSGVLSAGLSQTFEVPGGFESGRTYHAVCFIQDRAGGPPHAVANQMFTAFTVE